MVKSTWFGREDKKTRSWILSSQLHVERKTRRRDTGSSQVDLILTRRREDNIRDLVKSSSWEWKDEKTRKKTRSSISSSRLLQDEKTTRQDPGSCQVDLMRMKRREDKNLDLVKSTWWGREDGKTRTWISSSQLHEDEKTRRREKKDKILDLVKSTSFGREEQEDKIPDLVKSTWWGWKDEKTRTWISSSQLHEEEKTGRRDTGSTQVDLIWTRRQDPWSRQVDFIGTRSQINEDEKIRRRDTEYRQVDFIFGTRRREDEILDPRRWEEKITDLVMSTSSGQEDKKIRSWISSSRLD